MIVNPNSVPTSFKSNIFYTNGSVAATNMSTTMTPFYQPPQELHISNISSPESSPLKISNIKYQEIEKKGLSCKNPFNRSKKRNSDCTSDASKCSDNKSMSMEAKSVLETLNKIRTKHRKSPDRRFEWKLNFVGGIKEQNKIKGICIRTFQN